MASKKRGYPELAALRVHGTTRQTFLARLTLAAGATYGTTMAGALVSRAIAQQGGGDVDILNYALTLEYLERRFYEQGLDRVGLAGELRTLVEEIYDNESQHVGALRATIGQLGGTPRKEPDFDFADAYSDLATFLKTANTLEDTGVSAYNAAAANIRSPELLVAVGTIVQVEAHHASLIRLVRDKPPAPLAFDKASAMENVLRAILPFVRS